jgi:MFS family permease
MEQQTPKATTPICHQDRSSFQKFKYGLKLLLESPRQLFTIYAILILHSTAYSAITTVLTMFCSDELGMTDTEAGLVYGGLGIMIGLQSIALGPVVNILGYKVCTIISSLLYGSGAIIMGLVYDQVAFLLALLGLVGAANALSFGVLEMAAKRSTISEARNVNNSIVLLFVYLSGALAGGSIDLFWLFTTSKEWSFKLVFLTSAGCAFLAFLLTLTIEEINLEGEHDYQNYKNAARNVIVRKRFWRFTLLIFLLIILRSGCFGHLDATFPKYMTRELGDNSHFGLMLVVHSIVMLTGTILFTPLTYKLSSYTLIIIGGTLGALAPLILVLGASYLTCVLFVICISAGECIWVPRLLDYTINLAPHGQEGTYLALCNLPFNFGMILTGVMGGVLMDSYCSEDGDNECYKMWLIIGSITIVIPLMLIVFRNCLEQPLHEVQPIMPCFKKLEDNINIWTA